MPAALPDVATLLLAYVLLFLPRALVSLRARIAQAPMELDGRPRRSASRPAGALPAHDAPGRAGRRGRRRAWCRWASSTSSRPRCCSRPTARARSPPSSGADQRDRLRRRRTVCAADDPVSLPLTSLLTAQSSADRTMSFLSLAGVAKRYGAVAGARRRRPLASRGEPHGDRGTFGLGQDHAAAPDCRLRGCRIPAASRSTARRWPDGPKARPRPQARHRLRARRTARCSRT